MFPSLPSPSPAVRSHLDTLLAYYVDVSQRVIETLQNLSALNLQLGRDLLAESGANMQRLMASKDAAQLGSAFAAQLMPGMQSLQTYQRQLNELMNRHQAALAQAAADYMPAVRRNVTALAEDMVQEAASRTQQATEQMARMHPGSQLHH